jgi:hypothetical protein
LECGRVYRRFVSETASQQDIDRIASFVEACGELEKEPFFSKDEKLSFRSAGTIA